MSSFFSYPTNFRRIATLHQIVKESLAIPPKASYFALGFTVTLRSPVARSLGLSQPEFLPDTAPAYPPGLVRQAPF